MNNLVSFRSRRATASLVLGSPAGVAQKLRTASTDRSWPRRWIGRTIAARCDGRYFRLKPTRSQSAGAGRFSHHFVLKLPASDRPRSWLRGSHIHQLGRSGILQKLKIRAIGSERAEPLAREVRLATSRTSAEGRESARRLRRWSRWSTYLDVEALLLAGLPV